MFSWISWILVGWSSHFHSFCCQDLVKFSLNIFVGAFKTMYNIWWPYEILLSPFLGPFTKIGKISSFNEDSRLWVLKNRSYWVPSGFNLMFFLTRKKCQLNVEKSPLEVFWSFSLSTKWKNLLHPNLYYWWAHQIISRI